MTTTYRKVIAYTDGGCKQPGTPASYAFLVRCEQPKFSTGVVGLLPPGTNNTGELTAFIQLLKFLGQQPCDMTVYADSQYVTKGVSEWLPGWKARQWRKSNGKPILNLDLWLQVDALIAPHKIEMLWVPGHTGNQDNEWCDRMCTAVLEDPNRPAPPWENTVFVEEHN